MNISDTIKAFTTESGFNVGINTVMSALRPGCLYSIEAGNGDFVITEWPTNQWSDVTQSYVDAPTTQEIRDEYIRQQTIAECLEYFKEHGTVE
jgi:hypothetical protein